jgi:hypothetical protein
MGGAEGDVYLRPQFDLGDLIADQIAAASSYKLAKALDNHGLGTKCIRLRPSAAWGKDEAAGLAGRPWLDDAEAGAIIIR